MPEIYLLRKEVARATNRPWSQLSVLEKKRVAAEILSRRGDAESNYQSMMIQQNNPNFMDFRVVEQVSYPGL